MTSPESHKAVQEMLEASVASAMRLETYTDFDGERNPPKLRSYLRKASTVHSNEAFQNELNGIIQAQRDWMASYATTELEMTAGRMMIDAANRLRNRFLTLHTRFMDMEVERETD